MKISRPGSTQPSQSVPLIYDSQGIQHQRRWVQSDDRFFIFGTGLDDGHGGNWQLLLGSRTTTEPPGHLSASSKHAFGGVASMAAPTPTPTIARRASSFISGVETSMCVLVGGGEARGSVSGAARRQGRRLHRLILVISYLSAFQHMPVSRHTVSIYMTTQEPGLPGDCLDACVCACTASSTSASLSYSSSSLSCSSSSMDGLA